MKLPWVIILYIVIHVSNEFKAYSVREPLLYYDLVLLYIVLGAWCHFYTTEPVSFI